MTGRYDWSRVQFVCREDAQWTQDDARAFVQRVEEIADEEAARSVVPILASASPLPRAQVAEMKAQPTAPQPTGAQPTTATYSALVALDDETGRVQVEATSLDEARRLVLAEIARTDRAQFEIIHVQPVAS